MEIQKINIYETFKQNLQDPYCRYVIVQGMKDEFAGKELEHIPVCDLSSLNDLKWLARGMNEVMEMPPIDDEETPVEKLMPFTKLECSVQQRILYRAHVKYQKWFTFRERTHPLSLFKLIYL